MMLDFNVLLLVNVYLGWFVLQVCVCKKTVRNAMVTDSIVLQEFVVHTISSTQHVWRYPTAEVVWIQTSAQTGFRV